MGNIKQKLPLRFLKEYLHQLRRIVFNKDGMSNTLCLRKTIYLNFKCFKFSNAIKFPIWVYRYTQIISIGNLIIEKDDIPSGLIKIGSAGNASRKYTIIENYGTIIFKDTTSIFRGCYIYNKGTITFEGQNLLSEGCTIKIQDYLKMGWMSRFGTETYVIDTDFHYAVDINNGIIKRNTKGITIGESNWFGTRSFVKKGVKTGFGFVIAAPNTVLSKDYSNLDNYTVLGGNPAKPITHGLRRIFNVKEEKNLNQYFKEHPDDNYLNIDLTSLNLDEYCSNQDILA